MRSRELLFEIGCEELPASWLPGLTRQMAERIGARLARPTPTATSTPSTTAASSSRPVTRRPVAPSRSIHASSAPGSTAMGCTTACSWMQSNSLLCTWQALTRAAPSCWLVKRAIVSVSGLICFTAAR